MDFDKINMYLRLRDFDVPAAVLDTIFESKDNLDVLKKSWQELKDDGLNGDEIAKIVAKLIFDEIDTSLDLN